MALLALYAGALLGTYLISRLFWLLGRLWGAEGFLQAILLNGLSGAAITVIAAYGFADGGPPKFAEAALIYIPCQLFVLLTDILRTRPRDY